MQCSCLARKTTNSDFSILCPPFSFEHKYVIADRNVWQVPLLHFHLGRQYYYCMFILALDNTSKTWDPLKKKLSQGQMLSLQTTWQRAREHLTRFNAKIHAIKIIAWMQPERQSLSGPWIAALFFLQLETRHLRLLQGGSLSLQSWPWVTCHQANNTLKRKQRRKLLTWKNHFKPWALLDLALSLCLML